MNIQQKLYDFIDASPSTYHVVENIRARLVSAGYTELFETEPFSLTDGGKYFVVRDGSSIIAFRYRVNARSFMVCASHSDSPTFRLKLSVEKGRDYVTLDTEKYGGSIFYSWLDRPLSLAGRVIVRTDDGISERLVDLRGTDFVIPSLAIHFNRNVNTSLTLDPARDMLPLAGLSDAKGRLSTIIAEKAGVSTDDVIAHDLFLYVRDCGATFGINDEFMLCKRLDDLECVFASAEAFLAASDTNNIPVLAVFDNEEVGSQTKQGAGSTFLRDVLQRIGGENYMPLVASGCMLSADNAHALHPNHPEISDATNAPVINGGVVIKFNASQRYATDGVSAALFSEICRKVGVPVQRYYNRADLPGGSTLGSISDGKVPLPTVDIGLAQLAMHSAVETAGTLDLGYMIAAMTEFYSTYITKKGDNIKLDKTCAL